MSENIKEQIEDKVIDCINSAVAGRLIIFKPEKSNLGADLAVERRGKYKEKEIYFQINDLIVPAENKNFVKDFQQKNFKADKSFYLLFAYFDEIKQEINDYIWLIPSLEFRDIAEVVKMPDNEKLLRFESSADIKLKNKYSKFLIKKQDLGKTILGAMEKGGKFVFKEGPGGHPFSEKDIVNLENLKEFLSEARANTYAANATSADNPRLLASIQLEFQKGDYYYRDIFFSGDKKYIGQEIIYFGLKPVWGMNYIGSSLGKREISFLKESLLKLSEKCRMGGVCEYEKREFKYHDQGQGNLEEFSGKEEIFSEGKNIYKLNYNGGII
mgnify:CR=1 FL=1